jgi:RNA polymerase sigma-70 factor (ECF subfamily)
LLEAWKGEENFRGETSGERIAWLKTILGRVVARETRKYEGTQKRDPRRDIFLRESIEQSSILLTNMLVANGDSPSEFAANREQQVIIAEVLESLPDDYREVIVMRNLRGLNHAEIAEKLNRSESAVRMLWLRALKELQTGVLHRQ